MEWVAACHSMLRLTDKRESGTHLSSSSEVSQVAEKKMLFFVIRFGASNAVIL